MPTRHVKAERQLMWSPQWFMAQNVPTSYWIRLVKWDYTCGEKKTKLRLGADLDSCATCFMLGPRGARFSDRAQLLMPLHGFALTRMVRGHRKEQTTWSWSRVLSRMRTEHCTGSRMRGTNWRMNASECETRGSSHHSTLKQFYLSVWLSVSVRSSGYIFACPSAHLSISVPGCPSPIFVFPSARLSISVRRLWLSLSQLSNGRLSAP